MVEFKVNEDTNEWVFIEVNARFWGSLPLAIAAGADFPLALFQMMTEGRTSFKNDYNVGIYSRMLFSDIAWQLRNIKADRRDPTLLTIPPFKVILEWLINTITLKERIDTFAFDDQLPFYMELRQSIYRVVSVLGGKIGMRAINNSISRRTRLNHIQKKAANSKNVLFVCYGNVCRSPFAEHLTKKYLPTLKNVESAGFFKENGRKSPDEAISAALKFGVDLSGHRSKEITEDMVNAADIIFVFDYNNFKEITRKYRSAKDRTFFIGNLLPSESFFLDDPWGKPDNFYESVYRNIDQALLIFKNWMGNN
jgi:protein-tyrosine-phosphatase